MFSEKKSPHLTVKKSEIQSIVAKRILVFYFLGNQMYHNCIRNKVLHYQR